MKETRLTEAKRVARDIKRLQRMREIQSDHPLHRETVKVLDWAERSIDKRFAKFKDDNDKLDDLVRELKRPYRTDNQKHLVKAHDALCRENKGELPSYHQVWKKMRELFPPHCVPDKNTLRRLNDETLHLPMSHKTHAPNKSHKK